MKYIKIKLSQAYRNKNYKTFFKLLDEYISYGYGVDYDIIHFIIQALINTNKVNHAYKILKIVEHSKISDEIYKDLCYLYCYCYKPIEAEEIYFKYNINDNLLLIKIYLQQGKINEAYRIINENTNLSENNKYKKYKKLIENHYKYSSFIETEYNSFIKNGNNLEPGHIVFLKDIPTTNNPITNENKVIEKPYMIWKIEDNNVYLFPVIKVDIEKGFKLYSQNYRNILSDRKIGNHLYVTTPGNILSVKDKVSKEDFDNVLFDIFKSLYFGEIKDIINNKKFIDDYIGKIKPYDIVEIVNKISKEISCFLIIDAKDNEYKLLKIDIKNKKIVDNSKTILRDNYLVFKVIKPTKELLKELLNDLVITENQNKEKKKI